jgi:hypothetical protein
MQNHKKQDNISVNIINEVNEVKQVSQKPVGNADKNPFCVFDHKRHAVGSKISNGDGSESVCTDEGSWKHT